MWEHGHSFEEIDAMKLKDMGVVLGYWSEKDRIEKAEARRKKRLKKGK